MERKKREWTQARFNSFVKSALRSASRRWPPKYECLNEACVGVKKNKSTGRMAKHFKCNRCKKHFPQKEVEVNHIVPVVPITGFDSWDEVIKRMYCSKDLLEVVCIACHREISKMEREERKSKNEKRITRD